MADAHCTYVRARSTIDGSMHEHTHSYHTHTHTHSRNPASSSAPLCTSYNSLSSFETWYASCLVTAAWLSGYTPSFYPVSQWTLFFFFFTHQSEGFKWLEDAGGNGGGNTHDAHSRPCQSSLKVNREMWRSSHNAVLVHAACRLGQ